MVKNAIGRSRIDHKHPCKVLFALRIDWIKNYITCGFSESVAATTIDTTTGYEGMTPSERFGMYDDIFANFHYDIGHGKGTGEGSRDMGEINDGYNAGYSNGRVQGDRQTQYGQKTGVWELPGQPSRRF